MLVFIVHLCSPELCLWRCDEQTRNPYGLDRIPFIFFFFTKCPCCVNSLLGCVHSRNVPYAMGIRLNTCKNAGHRLQLFSTFGLLSAVCVCICIHTSIPQINVFLPKTDQKETYGRFQPVIEVAIPFCFILVCSRCRVDFWRERALMLAEQFLLCMAIIDACNHCSPPAHLLAE